MSGCNVLQEKYMKKETPVKEPPVSVTPVEKPAFYSKYYKFNTGQSYIRTVERNYYGMQAEMQGELNKYNIKKGLNIEEYNKYSKASFFQTDIFEIPADMKAKAVDLYKPLLDSIFMQVQNNQAFHAEILVLGYTDETPVPYDSPVYNQLLTLSRKKLFYNNDYYNVLSYYRAKEVGDIISTLLANKKNNLVQYEKASIDLIVEGKGIEYPDAKRTYQLEDDKRKITKVYWKIYK